jgi:hypothetical protein
MFGLKSEEERLFERIDKADAQVARMKEFGLPDSMMEHFAKTLRTTSYAYKGMTAKTLVEVVKNGNPTLLKKWNRMWEQMEDGTLHPREVFELYKALTGRKHIK